MKKIKFNKRIILGLIFIITMTLVGLLPSEVFAASGTATMSYDGPANAELNKNITYKVQLSNIVGDPITAAGGQIEFDSTYLELVSYQESYQSATLPYGFSFVESTKRFAGLSTSGRGITTTQTLLTLVFKPIKEGTTKLSITNTSVSDSNSNKVQMTLPEKTLTIGPAKSDNSFLSSFSVTGHTITPAFNKNTNNYALTVGNEVTSINVEAACEHPKATLSWTSGKAGTNSLNVGSNTITARCTAENGVGRNYVLKVTREGAAVPLSSDNNLKGLTVSGYEITPVFNKDTLEYSVTIPYEASEILVNADKNDPKATVNINGNTGLQVGNNVVEVTVIAENGTPKTYKINVTREEKIETPVEKDKDATLSKLNVSGYTLTPTFKPGINVYSMTVQSTVDGLKVEAIPTSSKAKVEIKGNLGWEYGMNTITITVTAENGDKNTYIVNVNRKDPKEKEEPKKSGDSYLSSLTVKGAELNPKFDKDRSSYDITVPYEIDKLDINFITSDKNAKVEILDNEPLLVNQKQTIRIRVTAEDGSVREYTINATRSAKSSNTYLKELSANKFLITPLFDKEVLNYKVTVKSNTNMLDLKAIAENENAKVEIFGNNDFKEGNNIVMIRVTDENGFNRIYQIEVEKPAKSILGMSLGQFMMFTLLGLGLLSLFLILLVVLKRSKKEEPTPAMAMPQGTTIDFKPEFNFGSRNGTDDDVVYPNGILNQGNGSTTGLPGSEPKKLVGTLSDANYKEVDDDDDENAPFDYFDETITKAELIEAIKEGMETKNPEKLKMLMKQDELNQMKKEIRRKEAAKKRARSDRHYEE